MIGVASRRFRQCRRVLIEHRRLSSRRPSLSPFPPHRHFSTAARRPPPVRVALTETAGRGVYATRPIAAGELVHTAKPLVAHPSPFLDPHDQKVCYYCLRRLTSETSGCSSKISRSSSIQVICSEGCLEHSKGFIDVEKKANWSEFADYCKSQNLKYPFLVKRFACMVIAGSASPETIDILQPAILSKDIVLQMEEEFQLLKSALSNAVDDELTSFLTKHWYVQVLARIRINAFRIEVVGQRYEDLLAHAVASVGDDISVGNAVYMLPSFYNHDCDPNMHIIWVDNADAKLKALRNIEADEELRICYIDASMDRNARQELLLNGFGFHCNCPRCIDDY